MSWREWLTARQLLTEEHLGVHLRARMHEEDELHRAALAKVRR